MASFQPETLPLASPSISAGFSYSSLPISEAVRSPQRKRAIEGPCTLSSRARNPPRRIFALSLPVPGAAGRSAQDPSRHRAAAAPSGRGRDSECIGAPGDYKCLPAQGACRGAVCPSFGAYCYSWGGLASGSLGPAACGRHRRVGERAAALGAAAAVLLN